MTCGQPFTSPEIDLEGTFLVCVCSYYDLTNYVFFPLPSFSSCPCLSLSFFFPLSPVSSTAEGDGCKSRGSIFFSEALISADDVSKEVKGTIQRPLQLLSAIHHAQIYVSLFIFFPFFLRHSRSLSYHIFNIINIDWAVHLEPLFNNWLPRLIQTLMVSADKVKEIEQRVWGWGG